MLERKLDYHIASSDIHIKLSSCNNLNNVKHPAIQKAQHFTRCDVVCILSMSHMITLKSWNSYKNMIIGT
jgi:hypothetical protein